MKVLTLATAAEAGAVAAREVAQALRDRPDAAFGVATGSSPLELYRHLADLVAEGACDVRGRTVFALDEYVGLPPGHPQSYHSVVHRDVTLPLGLDPALVHVPDGGAADPTRAAEQFERAVRSLGPRVQVLGIGANGHIGFNEPGSAWDSTTRRVTLTSSTREANSRFFPSLDDVPHDAVTQGIGTILAASTIVLVAHGAAKAPAVAAALQGPTHVGVPAAALRSHPDVRVVLDTAAAGLLRTPVGADA